MGRKINPKIIRLGISKDWTSKWFSSKEYAKFLLEDYRIREFFEKGFRHAGIAKVEINRSSNDLKVTIHTSKPGILIGRGGTGIEDIRKKLEKIVKRKIGVVIEEIAVPERNATLVGLGIAEQIEKRIPYRRAVKRAIEDVMRAGMRGIRIKVGGRLNGAEIARSEVFSQGKIPLSSLREDIDYDHIKAFTSYGVIGIKVWIYRKKIKEEDNILKN